MLMTRIVEIIGPKAETNCDACGKAAAVLQMHGYAEDDARNRLCSDRALQLVRKITEDLCELLTQGGRHG